MRGRRQSIDAAIRVLRDTCPIPAWTHAMGVCPVLHNDRWTVTVITVPPASIHVHGPGVRITVNALDVDRLPALLAASGAPNLAEVTA